MRILVNSDKNIKVDESVTRFVKNEVNRVLNRFTDKLTRVEVHLSDVNSSKFGTNDKRCMIEARPAKHRPLTVTDGAKSVKKSVSGALSKMRNSLQSFYGRIGKQSVQGATAKKVKGTTKIARLESAIITPARTKRKTTKRVVAKKNSAATTATAASGRSPKKKGIYQARRKSWPSK